LGEKMTRENMAILQRMPHVALPNHAFRNNGDSTFTDMATRWGLATPGFSNGAVYVDLDNRGTLDLVVNNINAPAAIYRNRAREINGHHYLTVALEGSGANTAGIGAKVTLAQRGGRGVRQMLEQMPTRGFQSSVDPRLHFGVGADARIDSLIVVWPDRRYQVLTNVSCGQTLTLSQRNATGRYPTRAPAPRPIFADVTARTGAHDRHVENAFADFDR